MAHPTPVVYLDNNIYAELSNNPSSAETNGFLQLANEGRIHVAMSLENIEETLPLAVIKEREIYERRFDLIRQLAVKASLFKPVKEYLLATFENYAKHRPPPNPSITDREILRQWSTWLHPEEYSHSQLLETIARIRQSKDHFRLIMADGQTKNAPLISKIRTARGGKAVSFKEYREKLMTESLANMVRPSGFLQACEKRGLSGLMENRSIAMLIGSNLSFIYAQDFEKRKPKIGDSVDLRHALFAGSCDFFISNDRHLSMIMKRVELPSLEITKLNAFLKTFRN